MNVRIGVGYDVHRLAAGRDLILGGVKIPFAKGLLGHSDADVLAHVLMDAILGALALGDIGRHFPDTDPSFSGASSIGLLEQVWAKADELGWQIGNVDSVIVAQSPRLAPYIPMMRANLARAVQAAADRISVKATTTEGLGFAGAGEGVAAHAVVLMTKKADTVGTVPLVSPGDLDDKKSRSGG